jgi:hypothetical protein
MLIKIVVMITNYIFLIIKQESGLLQIRKSHGDENNK